MKKRLQFDNRRYFSVSDLVATDAVPTNGNPSIRIEAKPADEAVDLPLAKVQTETEDSTDTAEEESRPAATILGMPRKWFLAMVAAMLVVVAALVIAITKK